MEIRGFPSESRRRTRLWVEDLEDLRSTLKTMLPEASANPRSPRVRPGCFLDTKRSTGIRTFAGYPVAKSAMGRLGIDTHGKNNVNWLDSGDENERNKN